MPTTLRDLPSFASRFWFTPLWWPEKKEEEVEEKVEALFDLSSFLLDDVCCQAGGIERRKCSPPL